MASSDNDRLPSIPNCDRDADRLEIEHVHKVRFKDNQRENVKENQ